MDPHPTFVDIHNNNNNKLPLPRMAWLSGLITPVTAWKPGWREKAGRAEAL